MISKQVWRNHYGFLGGSPFEPNKNPGDTNAFCELSNDRSGCTCVCLPLCGRAKFRTACIFESFTAGRAACGRSGPPHDRRRESFATGEPISCRSTLENS